MGQLQYRDFDLTIEPEGAHFVAQVLDSPAGVAKATFTFPFSAENLDDLIRQIGHTRSHTRKLQSQDMAAARELGGKLFNAVFGNEVLACFRESLTILDDKEEVGLRLKLRLLRVGELADVPWEFLFDTSNERFIAQSPRTPIIRYIDELPGQIKPRIIGLPLRLLVVISNPVDASLDVTKEKELLLQALGPQLEKKQIEVEWLERATFRDLQHKLRQRKYHIFHFIGHGGFDTQNQEGYLALVDENGNSLAANSTLINLLLQDQQALRLVVLNTCEGARTSRLDPFAGVATSLVRLGIPVVVAMQFEISDYAARIFSEEFYRTLAEDFPPDAALAEARKAIRFNCKNMEWGTPVMYSGSNNAPFKVKSALDPSESKTDKFLDGIQLFLNQDVEPFVRKSVPTLIETLTDMLTDGLTDNILESSLTKWRNRELITLNDMQEHVVELTYDWLKSEALRNQINGEVSEWLLILQLRLNQELERIGRECEIPARLLQKTMDYHLDQVNLDNPAFENTKEMAAIVETTGGVTLAIVGLIQVSILSLGGFVPIMGQAVIAGVLILGGITALRAKSKPPQAIKRADIPLWMRRIAFHDAKIKSICKEKKSELRASIYEHFKKNLDTNDKLTQSIIDLVKATIKRQTTWAQSILES